MEYSGWKQLSRVNIIYSTGSIIKYNNKSYTKAYISEAGTTKACMNSLSAGKNWAKGWMNKDKEPVVIETDNKGFSFQIVSAAGRSWSQGGKLSFWMCIMEKEGLEPFAVGINSELLADLILESTIYKGSVKEKVFFARKNGQLGVLHENMPSYKELLKDQELKKDINRGKTTKWKIGYEYNTLTQSDVMFGYFSPIAEIDHAKTDWYREYREKTISLDFSIKDKPFFTGVVNNNWKDSINNLYWQSRHLPDKCPSRKEGNQIFIENEDYYKVFAKQSFDHFISGIANRFLDSNIVVYAFTLFRVSPETTIKILETVRDYIKQAIYNIEHNIKDDFNKFEYENVPNRFNVNCLIYKRAATVFHIDYKGTRYTFNKDIIGYYNKLIEIAQIEKGE